MLLGTLASIVIEATVVVVGCTIAVEVRHLIKNKLHSKGDENHADC